MGQLPLFVGSAEIVLADGPRGRIVYQPGVVSADVARTWFDELRAAVAWEHQRRRMYDREVDVPRLLAHYRLGPDGDAVPHAVRAAASRVVAVTGVPFNSVGLNLYRDGRDSVAPHGDHLDEIVAGFPIALLSLGATRPMAIRAVQPPRRAFQVDLAPGSLLVMGYETQRHYSHGIPKIAEPVGPRISLAFRVKPERGSGRPGSIYR